MTTPDEALLEWAEERLTGLWEDCSDCGGAGSTAGGSGQPCPSCYGEGRIPRYGYLEAERALSDEQKAGLGEMLEPSAIEFGTFKLED